MGWGPKFMKGLGSALTVAGGVLQCIPVVGNAVGAVVAGVGAGCVAGANAYMRKEEREAAEKEGKKILSQQEIEKRKAELFEKGEAQTALKVADEERIRAEKQALLDEEYKSSQTKGIIAVVVLAVIGVIIIKKVK